MNDGERILLPCANWRALRFFQKSEALYPGGEDMATRSRAGETEEYDLRISEDFRGFQRNAAIRPLFSCSVL